MCFFKEAQRDLVSEEIHEKNFNNVFSDLIVQGYKENFSFSIKFSL